MENVDDYIEKIRRYAKKSEKSKRYEHSVRVAETAEYMCSLYGIDAKKGYLAGIAHDICKNISEEEMKSLAIEDGRGISDVENLKPSLLHGRAAAVLLTKEFGITDPDVIQAVAVHTFGGVGICDLAKIVFCADKIEPGREHSTEEYRSRLFAMTLDEMTLYIVEENMAYLKKKGKKIAPSTFEFRDSLEKEIGGRK